MVMTIDSVASKWKWTPVEIKHAKSSLENKYGEECELQLSNGRVICTPAYPASCDYIRITHHGFELGYWDINELKEAPEEVLGAVIGLAKGLS